MAPVPDLNTLLASGVYAPNVNKLFVFGGERVSSATVVDTTRIYDIATNTWSPERRCLTCAPSWHRATTTARSTWSVVIEPAASPRRSSRPGRTIGSANTFVTKTSIPASAGFAGAGSGVVLTVICTWPANAMPTTP